MERKTISKTIRGLDKESYMEVRSESIMLNKSMGECLNEAMNLWLIKSRRNKK